MLTKPHRQTDPEFLAYLRGQPCVSCGATAPNDPNHLKTVGSGGSDYTAVTQCRICHGEFHQLGLTAFNQKRGVNLWRLQSGQVVAYLTDPAVILRKAAEIDAAQRVA